MNKQVLEEIQPILRANAHAFVMGDYVARRDEHTFNEVLEPEQNICGSACCIGGTIVAHVDKVDLLAVYGSDRWKIGDRAAEILGVGDEASDVGLFHKDFWPYDLRLAYDAAGNDRERVEVACQAIQLFADDPDSFSCEDEDDDDDEDEDDSDVEFLDEDEGGDE